MSKFSLLRLAVLAVPFASVSLAADATVIPPDPQVRPSGQTVKPATVLEREKKAMQPTAAAPKEWADEVKQPADWFKWGADLRLRYENHENATAFNENADNESSYTRYRARAWFGIGITEDIVLSNRWVWEGRHFWQPDARDGFYDDYIIADQLNFQFNKLGGTESFVTVGRQDISMHDGWLVMDGTPLDGSRTGFFDAVRAQIDLKDAKSVLDMVVLANRSQADDWSPIIGGGDDEASLVEQNEVGGIVNFVNKSFEGFTLGGFGMYKHAEPVLGNGDEGDIFVVGARAEHKIDDHWSAKATGAYEFGHKDNPVAYPGSDGDLSAWGVNSRIAYAFNDSMKNVAGFEFEFLSGDDPDTSTNEAFDIMWGRWARFSDLYAFTAAADTTRPADYTNLFRFGPVWQVQPVQPLVLTAAYYALFADETTYEANAAAFGDDYFRGHLFVTSARYKFNRFASAALMAEYMVPGGYNSSDRQDDAMFFRAELVLTF